MNTALTTTVMIIAISLWFIAGILTHIRDILETKDTQIHVTVQAPQSLIDDVERLKEVTGLKGPDALEQGLQHKRKK